MKAKEDTQKASINNSLLSFIVTSTVNKIGGKGTKSLSEALKSNTTLTKLNLSCEDKRKKTPKTYINNSLFPFLFTSTDNNIGKRGAKSLSEALKLNAALTQLDLSSENKGDTQDNSINKSLFSFHFTSTGNNIECIGATSLSEALKSNTTLTTLDLGGEDKRKKTHKKAFINNLLFSLFTQNSKQNWRKRNSIIE